MSNRKNDPRPKTWKKAVEFYTRLHIQQNAQMNPSDKKDIALNMGFDDPLGIVKISSSSDERSHKWREKIWALESIVKNEEDSEKNGVIVPSIVVYKESFVPTLFLAKVHDKTPYDDLKDRTKAPMNLQRRRGTQEDEIRVLVKNNLEKFIRAKDSLDDIYNTKDSLFTSNSVEKLTHKYHDFQHAGESLLKPLWMRKKNGEDIKSALGLIQKYELIFAMPDQIKYCILSKDYKKVVHDYEKAKYFKKKCKSQMIFQKTFTAIDSEIQKLRDSLFSQLTIDENNEDIDLKVLVDDQEKFIYYLYALDSTIDPAETSLRNWINYVAYLLKVSVSESLPQKIAQVGGGSIGEIDFGSKDSGKRDTMALKTVTKLTSTLLKNFPLIYKLAKNILQDKYLKKQVTNKQKQQENAMKKQEFISQLINDNIFSTYEKKITQVLSNIDIGTAHQETYFSAIKDCLNCTVGIMKLEMPQAFTKRLQDFTTKLKNNYIESTWKRTINQISSSYSSEDFVILEEFGVTTLPLKFRDNLLQTISIMSNFVSPRDPLVTTLISHFLSCIASFADCLHQLAFPGEKQATEEQLLVVLNSIYYTKENILFKVLYQFVDKFIYEADTRYEKEVEAAVYDFLNPKKNKESFHVLCLFDDLEQLILSSFVQRRTQALIPHFDKGIHLSGYNWKKSSSPDSIRSFVLELLVDLALVHSSVERKAKNYTKEIFGMLNENVVQIFEQYIRFELENISINAAFQLDIEFDFIQKALKKYLSKKSKVRDILKKLKTYVIEISGFDPGDVTDRQKAEIINDFTVKTRVQLDCFVNERENQQIENPRGWGVMKSKLMNTRE